MLFAFHLKAICYSGVFDSPIIDRDSLCCHSKRELPGPFFQLLAYLLFSNQKEAGIKRKFNHFPRLTLFYLKPERVFKPLRLKAVGEFCKEIVIDFPNINWQTFAELGV